MDQDTLDGIRERWNSYNHDLTCSRDPEVCMCDIPHISDPDVAALVEEVERLQQQNQRDNLLMDILYNPLPFSTCVDDDGSEKAQVQGGIFSVLINAMVKELSATDIEKAPNFKAWVLEVTDQSGMRVEITAIRPNGKGPSQQMEDAKAEARRLRVARDTLIGEREILRSIVNALASAANVDLGSVMADATRFSAEPDINGVSAVHRYAMSLISRAKKNPIVK